MRYLPYVLITCHAICHKSCHMLYHCNTWHMSYHCNTWHCNTCHMSYHCNTTMCYLPYVLIPHATHTSATTRIYVSITKATHTCATCGAGHASSCIFMYTHSRVVHWHGVEEAVAPAPHHLACTLSHSDTMIALASRMGCGGKRQARCEARESGNSQHLSQHLRHHKR